MYTVMSYVSLCELSRVGLLCEAVLYFEAPSGIPDYFLKMYIMKSPKHLIYIYV